MFDLYTIEELLSSMQKATLTVVNVPVPKSPLNYSPNTQIALDNKSEFGLSQHPTFKLRYSVDVTSS